MLRDELLNDPLARGYSGMSDENATADLNTAYRERNRDIMSSSEILNAVDDTELTALTSAEQIEFWQLMAIGNLNPFGVEATIMVRLFGGGSTTITALAAMRKEPISRAVEVPGIIAPVKPGHVEEARRG